MKNDYFSRADFSDFEKELNKEEVPVVVKSTFVPATPEGLRQIREKMEMEMRRAETGTSPFCPRAIQASTATPTKLMLDLMITDFSEKQVEIFVDVLKQDYGYQLANWAAEYLSQWHPGIVTYFKKER